MDTWKKIALSVAGATLVTISSTYSAHPDAPVMAYIAAGSGAVGMYLVGLFQGKPGQP